MQTAAQAAQLNDDQLSRLAQVARTAAERGGAELMRHYGRLASIQSKGRQGDLVTNADVAAERVVLDVLAEQTPDIAVLAEESGAAGAQDDLRWCVDPLDGTTNFAHGYPFFATSIGLTYRQQPVLGAIAVPFLQETYWGAPGFGAYCNEQPIQVSDCCHLGGCPSRDGLRLRPPRPARQQLRRVLLVHPPHPGRPPRRRGRR